MSRHGAWEVAQLVWLVAGMWVVSHDTTPRDFGPQRIEQDKYFWESRIPPLFFCKILGLFINEFLYRLRRNLRTIFFWNLSGKSQGTQYLNRIGTGKKGKENNKNHHFWSRISNGSLHACLEDREGKYSKKILRKFKVFKETWLEFWSVF